MQTVALLITLAIVWCINYFVLRIAGIFLDYTFTIAECTGIFILLLWVRCMIGGERS